MSFNYKFVEDKEFLARVQKSCNDDMIEIESILRNEYDISCQYFLIGSGAKNMITEDSNGIIDLDYNINVYNGMNYDGKRLKTAVICAANQVMKKNGLEDVNDSTSSIETKRVHFKDDPDKREFNLKTIDEYLNELMVVGFITREKVEFEEDNNLLITFKSTEYGQTRYKYVEGKGGYGKK